MLLWPFRCSAVEEGLNRDVAVNDVCLADIPVLVPVLVVLVVAVVALVCGSWSGPGASSSFSSSSDKQPGEYIRTSISGSLSTAAAENRI